MWGPVCGLLAPQASAITVQGRKAANSPVRACCAPHWGEAAVRRSALKQERIASEPPCKHSGSQSAGLHRFSDGHDGRLDRRGARLGTETDLLRAHEAHVLEADES